MAKPLLEVSGTMLGQRTPLVEKAQQLYGFDNCDMGQPTTWAKPMTKEASSQVLLSPRYMDLGPKVQTIASPYRTYKSPGLYKPSLTNKKLKRVTHQVGLNPETKLASWKRIAEVILMVSSLSNQKKSRHLFEVSDETIFTSHTELAVVALQPY